MVETFCQKTGHNAMPNPVHLAVVPSLKILYCLIPKAASNEWRNMLYQFNKDLGERYRIRLVSYPSDEWRNMLYQFNKDLGERYRIRLVAYPSNTSKRRC